MPRKITLVYIALSIFWLVASDQLLDWMVRDFTLHNLIATSKGLLFVTVSATALYWAVRQYIKKALSRERAVLILRRQSQQQPNRVERPARATIDPLTGLINRNGLEKRLESLAASGSRSPGGLLGVCDIDLFTSLNDRFGYDFGDHVLRTVAERLRTAVADEGIVARLGAAEFAVLLPDLAPSRALPWLHDLHCELQHFRVQAGAFTAEPTFSFGGTTDLGTRAADRLLHEAESALALARARGGDRVEFYRAEESDLPLKGAEYEWATRIRNGVRKDLFELHFQPVVHLPTGRVTHLEALLRYREPSGELVFPEAIIPKAEALHLMPLIDRWVVDKVLARLDGDPQIEVFVNLNGQSLDDAETREYISREVAARPGAARRLTFEITETSAVHGLTSLRDWMLQLLEQGCRFALDDFGAGFSSFAYLEQLPVDIVKIDGSFIREMHRDPPKLTMVRSMVDISHSLGKLVVAEWVENQRTIELLKELGVAYGQGFALGRPAPLPQEV